MYVQFHCVEYPYILNEKGQILLLCVSLSMCATSMDAHHPTALRIHN